ncbi:GLABRA2 like protein [Arabidopsis thaliana]|nr:GLABRA2 like protein [Arabidopsis thaliana]CAB78774.1 GLABRA2 like protein [Arabidopsis thaliana]
METKDKKEKGHMVLNSDNVFGSVSSSPTTTIQNPNYFTSFENPNFPYIFPKEEYEVMSKIESGSGKSTGSGHDPVENTAIEQEPPAAKKKRYHRHTASQIQQMEALFKENAHPDTKTRLRLSKKLGLSPIQVKFWFQNKRTQIKAQQSRSDNAKLKAENETLKTESQNIQSNFQCLFCSTCGHNLRLENARLRQELDRLRSIVSMRNPSPSQEITPETNKNNNDNMLIAEEEKAIDMELAVSCARELAKMCDINEPLWNKKRLDNESVCLNEEEYKKMFLWPLMNDDDRFRREASRANAVIMLNCITLVKAFLDADKWSEMFFPIVSSAKTAQIISSGASGPSGTLLLQNAEEGKWMVVDFPIDRIKPASATTTDQYRRKPSGCIIQAMRNGYSQVTWVEHVEVEEKHVQDEVVREFVESGVAFGAERWLSVLKRQCERMASLMATNITDLGGIYITCFTMIPSVEARKNLMKLSQRMVKTFCLNIINSHGQAPTKDTVKIVSRKVCGGLVPCAVSVTLLPYSHQQVFDLLRDNQRLSQVESNSSHNVELMLQETCTDNSGSLLVYSTVDPVAVQLAMNGEDPSEIPLLPVGFSVVPVNPSDGVEGSSVSSPSCLLTVAIQVLGSNVTTERLDLSTVSVINHRICATVNRITSALVNDVGN